MRTFTPHHLKLPHPRPALMVGPTNGHVDLRALPGQLLQHVLLIGGMDWGGEGGVVEWATASPGDGRREGHKVQSGSRFVAE